MKVAGEANIVRAFRYVLSHWNRLTILLNYQRRATDTNTVALGRKDTMFAGSDSPLRRWPILTVDDPIWGSKT
jgi:hypothetical protein